MYYVAFLRLAARAAAIYGVVSSLQEAWRAIEDAYYQNFSTDPLASQKAEKSAQMLLVANEILEQGGLALARALYSRGGISPSLYLRCILVQAIRTSASLPPSVKRLEEFNNIFNESAQVAYTSTELEPRVRGLLLRQLEVSGLVDFYRNN